MTEWLKRIEEWSRHNDAIADKDIYSTCLLALAFLGLGLKIPFIFSVMVQVCLVICTLDLAYRYLKMKNYAMCVIRIAPLILVALFDSVSLTFK